MNPPPHFRFYPGAYDDGAIARDDRSCEVCGVARGLIYRGVVKGAGAPTHVCPWCIADGRASAVARPKYGAFNDVDNSAEKEGLDEVAGRTPASQSWQDFAWPAHAGAPMIYEGRVDFAGVKDSPARLAALRAAVPDEKTMIEWVSKDSDVNVMLFRSMDGSCFVGIFDAS